MSPLGCQSVVRIFQRPSQPGTVTVPRANQFAGRLAGNLSESLPSWRTRSAIWSWSVVGWVRVRKKSE